MTRQAFVRVLLSLLLLISQQMASSHVMSHLAGSVVASAVQADDTELSKAFAQDQTCNQCLAFAQLSGPLASAPPAFGMRQQQPMAVAVGAVPAARASIITAFQSRAPPFLS